MAKRVETRRQMLSAGHPLANPQPGDPGTENMTILGGKRVQYVRAGDLRGMAGNPVEDDKVNALKTEVYNEPVILEYSPESGYGYIGEGNHRLAARGDDELVPLYIYARSHIAEIHLKNTWKRPRQFTRPYELCDENGYCPSQLLPSHLGFQTYPAPVEVDPQSPYRLYNNETKAFEDKVTEESGGGNSTNPPPLL